MPRIREIVAFDGAGEAAYAPRDAGRVSIVVSLSLVALTFGGLTSPIFSQTSQRAAEYEIKAAFLYNFAKSIAWSPAAMARSGNVVSVCVLGRDPFGTTLAAIDGRVFDGKTLELRRFDRPAAAASCSLLFVPSSEDARLREIFDSVAGSEVLTVGETELFAELGGAIRFVSLDDKIQFIIDLSASSAANVTFPAELLRLSDSTGAQWEAAMPWYEHYAAAMRSLERQDWERAVSQLNDALGKKGDSGTRVRTSGRNEIAYFPYMQLGIAYFHLGQLDAALQAFETEERIGAIADSEPDARGLASYRSDVAQAQQVAAAAERRRAEQIVLDSLRRARELDAAGRLDDALTALDRGLAVASDNADALELRDRLRTQLAERERARERGNRAATLVDEGRTLLDAGRFDEASRVFRQAESLEPTPEISSLLEQARAALLADIGEAREQTEQRTLVSETLARARSLEAAGDIVGSLDDLQAVLALDPDNADALELQKRLIDVRARTDAMRAREASLGALLADAQREYDQGRHESALSIANRVLALEPGNSSALEVVSRAYRQINQRLLGSSSSGNIPPAIRFADFREELDDGIRAQRVSSPEFALSGVVIDNTPVSIEFYDAADRPLPGTSSSQPLGSYYVTQFNLRGEVGPGVSTFRLVAKDAEELSSASSYSVFYDRPLHRSPWLYSFVGFGLVAAATGAFVKRARRRRELRQRRFNPYVAGAPILDESLFFGRTKLLNRVLQTIHNNSLLLYGERRIGKTSFQHHLKRRLMSLDDPKYRFYPVYIDLQGTPEERFFATMAEDLFQDLGHVLHGVEPSEALTTGATYTYRDFVHDVRRVLKELKSKSTKQVKLVLLIDEVDELNDYDPKINQRLRSLFMKNMAEHLVAVVSGVAIKKQWEKEGSPWYNFFEEMEVMPFQRSDAVELIQRPIRGIFTLEDGLVDRIISVTDCKPYPIQKLCIALVNRAHEENRSRITVSDVDSVWRPDGG